MKATYIMPMEKLANIMNTAKEQISELKDWWNELSQKTIGRDKLVEEKRVKWSIRIPVGISEENKIK